MDAPAAGASGGDYLAPARTTASDAQLTAARQSPIVPLRLGLLSTARINREIVRAARATDALEVVAVASRDPGRARAYAEEHGVERAHGSYDELLADGEIDAVYVALPSAHHVPWSVRALVQGKHVLCEKPLAGSPEAVAAAANLAEERALVFTEAFMYRHHPQTARVEELVRGGAIGPLRSIRGTFSFALTDEANIRMRPELGGGALLDLGSYCVSGARLLAGEPDLVYGEAVRGTTGVDLAFHGTMRFPGDAVAQFEASFVAPLRQGLEAVGEEGVLVVDAPWRQDWGGDVWLVREGEWERIEVPQGDAYREELEDFAAAVRGDRPPLLGRADLVGQARALDALARSADARRPLPVATPA